MRNSIIAAMCLPLLLGCASRVDTPDEAIAVGKRACLGRAKPRPETPAATWKAKPNGDNWEVTGEIPYHLFMTVSVSRDGEGKADCLLIHFPVREINAKDFQLKPGSP